MAYLIKRYHLRRRDSETHMRAKDEENSPKSSRDPRDALAYVPPITSVITVPARAVLDIDRDIWKSQPASRQELQKHQSVVHQDHVCYSYAADQNP